ncbi:MAG TPA: MobA/MobL family protein [Aliidongia sp.]|nr:MobA/MobL family protein [Aliidongia sp.]
MTLTHIKLGVVSRSSTSERATGGNSVALAAYHACTRLSHDGRAFDFTRKRGELAAETVMLLPPGAPAWAADPETLWRRVEAADKKANATSARWLQHSIPREVPPDLWSDYARSVVQIIVDTYHVAVQLDLHCTVASDGERQPHLHALIATRSFDGAGFSKKKSAALDQGFRSHHGRDMRRKIADAANAFLGGHRIDARLDPERQDDQGLGRELDVSRTAVKVWQQQPEHAEVFPAILRDRQARRQARVRVTEARSDIRAADRSIATAQALLTDLTDPAAPAISPGTAEAREDRRRKFLAALLASQYDKAWLPPSVAKNVAYIRTAPGVVQIGLTDGSRLLDTGDQIRVIGRPSDLAIRELVAAADRHGWTSPGGAEVRIWGSPEFRRGVALELLGRHPPVHVQGLSDADRAYVAAELARQAAQQRQAAMAALASAERQAATAWQATQGRREAGDLMRIRDAQMAVSRGDQATTTAAAAGDMDAAMTAGQAWRRRLAPQHPTAAREDSKEAVVQAPGCTPRYVPQWSRGPNQQAT